jgi:hypothetical protein
MTVSKYKPLMTYLEQGDLNTLKKYAKKHKITMSQVIREALGAKFAQGDPYVAGFNEGVDQCIKKIFEIQGAQMRFPSGKSVAELIEEELVKLQMIEINLEAP